MRTIQRGREALQDDVFDEPLIVDNSEIVIPSHRTLLDHEEMIHTSSLQHQKQNLVEVKKASLCLDNVIRQHKQNYDYKFQRLLKPKSLKIIPHLVVLMFKELWKKIREWYQSQNSSLRPSETHQQAWKFTLQQADLANEVWYAKPTLDSPARESLEGLSDG